MIELILLSLAAALFSLGYCVSKFTSAPKRVTLFGLFAIGLFGGAFVGTTHTHAFDILWWWKGIVFGILLAGGGAWVRRP